MRNEARRGTNAILSFGDSFFQFHNIIAMDNISYFSLA